METKIEKISELSKLLSVKTRMSDDLFHLFGKFGIGHLLSRLSLEKQDGITASELILSLCLFRIVSESIHHICKHKGLQQFGVISFEIRTLMYCHTERGRTQRFYIVVIVRHRGTVGAWRNRGYLRVLLMILFTSLQSSGLHDFLKRLFVYYQSYQQYVHYISVALCAFGTSVRLSAFTSVLSPSLCAFYM